jgi:hypothetical protein
MSYDHLFPGTGQCDVQKIPLLLDEEFTLERVRETIKD